MGLQRLRKYGHGSKTQPDPPPDSSNESTDRRIHLAMGQNLVPFSELTPSEHPIQSNHQVNLGMGPMGQNPVFSKAARNEVVLAARSTEWYEITIGQNPNRTPREHPIQSPLK